MITKSKNAKLTQFFIPNTPAGQALLDGMKEHLNKVNYKIDVRGRHENRKQLAQEITQSKQRHVNGNGGAYWNGEHASLRQHVPLDRATYFAVYVSNRESNPSYFKELYLKGLQHYDQLQEKLSVVVCDYERIILAWKYKSELDRQHIENLTADLQNGVCRELAATEISWRKAWKMVVELLFRHYHALISRLGW